MIKVVKFGGSSLADAVQIKKAGKIVLSEESRRYVVPSAPGKRFSDDTKVTDMLYRCYGAAVKEKKFTELLADIQKRYQEIIEGLGITLSLDEEFATIRDNFAKKIGRDYAASRGEYLNGRVIAAYLGYEFIDAAEVIKYYNTSLGVLKDMVKEKDVNAVLDYMEQKGKAPALSAIVPPAVASKDSAIVLNPGNCFNEETRQNLKQNYTGLFQARTEFYANFDTYLSYLKKKDVTNAKKLLDVNYQLSTQMSEYKQNIFDILSPFTEQAELVLLVDNPLKAQIMSVRKMSSTMQSILNLYARKHRMDGPRIDLKVAELTQQLDAAKKLPVVNGHEGEMKSYQAFLSQVETFIKQVKKVREKGEYSDADYDMLTSAFETSII